MRLMPGHSKARCNHVAQTSCLPRRLVETAIYSLLTDDGRRAAHNLFKEAAATM